MVIGSKIAVLERHVSVLFVSQMFHGDAQKNFIMDTSKNANVLTVLKIDNQ